LKGARIAATTAVPSGGRCCRSARPANPGVRRGDPGRHPGTPRHLKVDPPLTPLHRHNTAAQPASSGSADEPDCANAPPGSFTVSGPREGADAGSTWGLGCAVRGLCRRGRALRNRGGYPTSAMAGSSRPSLTCGTCRGDVDQVQICRVTSIRANDHSGRELISLASN
jgi:hypothetical protein